MVPFSGGDGGGLVGTLTGSGGSLLGVVGLDLIRVTVEEEIGEDGPLLAAVDGSSETEHFSAEEVPNL